MAGILYLTMVSSLSPEQLAPPSVVRDSRPITKFLSRTTVPLQRPRSAKRTQSDFDNLAGQTFGEWRVLAVTKPDEQSKRYVRCLCLGCETEHFVGLSDLLLHKSSRCGACGKRAMTRTKHIERLGRVPDDLDTRLAERWRNLRQRCYNPDHPNYNVYGGRGIRVSDEFQNATVFIDYMRSLPNASVNLTIDRIDTNGNYERGNLRWATRKQQGRNFRHTLKFPDGTSYQDAAEALPQYDPNWVVKVLAAGGTIAELLAKPRKGWQKDIPPVYYGGQLFSPSEFLRFVEVSDGQRKRVSRLAREGLSGEKILLQLRPRKHSRRFTELRAAAQVLDTATRSK